MDRIAVSVDAAHDHAAIVIGENGRLHVALAAALGRFLPCGSRILHLQREHLHAVAMLVDVIGDRVVTAAAES